MKDDDVKRVVVMMTMMQYTHEVIRDPPQTWRHLRHCRNTPPRWKYRLCVQKLSKMRKSDIYYTPNWFAEHACRIAYNKVFEHCARLWRNTDVTTVYLQHGGVCRMTSLSLRCTHLYRMWFLQVSATVSAAFTSDVEDYHASLRQHPSFYAASATALISDATQPL